MICSRRWFEGKFLDSRSTLAFSRGGALAWSQETRKTRLNGGGGGRHCSGLGETGPSRSTVWCLAKSGDFPKPLRLGQKAIGWRRADVEDWLDTRPTVE